MVTLIFLDWIGSDKMIHNYHNIDKMHSYLHTKLENLLNSQNFQYNKLWFS